MNDKELKRLLAKQSAQVLPDDRVKDRIKRELNIPRRQRARPDKKTNHFDRGGSRTRNGALFGHLIARFQPQHPVRSQRFGKIRPNFEHRRFLCIRRGFRRVFALR